MTDLPKDKKELLEQTLTNHKLFHSYFSALLETEESKSVAPRYTRCDPQSNLNPTDPVVLRLLDHYLTNVSKVVHDLNTTYTCSQCETTLKHFKIDTCGVRQKPLSVAERLKRQIG